MASTTNTVFNLDKAFVNNVKDYLSETASLRNDSVANTRDELVQILLHETHFQHVPSDVTDTRIAKELNVSKALVQKHRKNKTPFKKIKASRKKRTEAKFLHL
jgi:FixJ family two-component response regulator